MWVRHLIFTAIMVLIMLVFGIYAYNISNSVTVSGEKSTAGYADTSIETVSLSWVKRFLAEEIANAKVILKSMTEEQKKENKTVLSLQDQQTMLTLIQGEGIGIDGYTIANIDRGSSQSIFSNIAVGNTLVTANSNTDTLTLEAGTNITLTTDTDSKRIKIGASYQTSSVFENLTVGTNAAVYIDQNGRLAISYKGDSGHLSSSGGAMYLNNSDNNGTALGIYSNAGAEALGNMINVKVDNTAYSQAAFYMNYDGNSNAVEIVSNSTDTSSNALAVTGNNINDSTLGIIGNELNKGTIKVTHYRPTGGTDSNASAISIDLKGVGTRAQGLYVDSTEAGGTLGNLLRLRNMSNDKFVVDYQGNLTISGNITQGSYGTDTTWTKYGTTTGDQFFVGTNGSFRVQRAASNSEAFRVQISGDTQGRWRGTSDGSMQWGDGTNAQDVILRRGASGTLWLTGGMVLNNANGVYNTVVKGTIDSNLLYVNASTNSIGVGTSNPNASLHIEKNALGNAALLINQQGTGRIISASASGSTVFTLDTAGNVRTVGSLCVKTSITSNCAGSSPGTIYAGNTTVQAADLAENYISSQQLTPGDIVAIADDTHSLSVVRSTTPYQKKILGVVSTNPGITMNSDAQTDSEHPFLYPIALQGRVPIRISNENGPVTKGDNLTTSSRPGVAMKATGRGIIIAKALENFSEQSEGKIMAFIHHSLNDEEQIVEKARTNYKGTITLPTGQTEILVSTIKTQEQTLFVQAENAPIATAVEKKADDTFLIKTSSPQPFDVTLHWILPSEI